MDAAEKILEKMEEILNKIIANAETLNEISKMVISEEELTPLQNDQDDLFNQLLELDAEFSKASPDPHPHPLAARREKFDEKLKLFEKLNQIFIDNLKTTHGLIQFDFSKIRKQP